MKVTKSDKQWAEREFRKAKKTFKDKEPEQNAEGTRNFYAGQMQYAKKEGFTASNYFLGIAVFVAIVAVVMGLVSVHKLCKAHEEHIHEERIIGSGDILTYPHNAKVNCQQGVSVERYDFLLHKSDVFIYGCPSIDRSSPIWKCSGEGKLCIIDYTRKVC